MAIQNMGLLIYLCGSREGRSEDVKQQAISKIFEALKAYTAPAMATHSIALSAEMRDIDATLSPKYGTIREHMKG